MFPLTRHRPGFTVLELIIVVVILGVLATAAVPTYAAVKDETAWQTLIRTAEAYGRDAVATHRITGGTGQVSTTAIATTSAETPVGVTVDDTMYPADAQVQLTQGTRTVCLPFTADGHTGPITRGPCGTPPGPPVPITVTIAPGPGQLGLTWTRVDAATEYIATCTAPTQPDVTVTAANPPSGDPTASVTGLAGDTTYTCTVASTPAAVAITGAATATTYTCPNGSWTVGGPSVWTAHVGATWNASGFTIGGTPSQPTIEFDTYKPLGYSWANYTRALNATAYTTNGTPVTLPGDAAGSCGYGYEGGQSSHCVITFPSRGDYDLTGAGWRVRVFPGYIYNSSAWLPAIDSTWTFTGATCPVTPTTLTAVGTAGTAQLTWTGSPLATGGYDVVCEPATAGPATITDHTSPTTTTWTGATMVPGQTYNCLITPGPATAAAAAGNDISLPGWNTNGPAGWQSYWGTGWTATGFTIGGTPDTPTMSFTATKPAGYNWAYYWSAVGTATTTSSHGSGNGKVSTGDPTCAYGSAGPVTVTCVVTFPTRSDYNDDHTGWTLTIRPRYVYNSSAGQAESTSVWMFGSEH